MRGLQAVVLKVLGAMLVMTLVGCASTPPAPCGTRWVTDNGHLVASHTPCQPAHTPPAGAWGGVSHLQLSVIAPSSRVVVHQPAPPRVIAPSHIVPAPQVPRWPAPAPRLPSCNHQGCVRH